MKIFKVVTVLTWVAFYSSQLQAKEIAVSVRGMFCAFCAAGIEKKFKQEPSVQSLQVSLEKKLVKLEIKKGQDLSDKAITDILTDSGYNVDKIERN